MDKKYTTKVTTQGIIRNLEQGHKNMQMKEFINKETPNKMLWRLIIRLLCFAM